MLRIPYLLAFFLALALGGCSDNSSGPEATLPSQSVAAALGGDPADLDSFARVLAPRPFRFPEDHGPHPDYRTEWWYFTGHLESEAGAYFGFQLTFFRTALPHHEDDAPRTSSWAPQSTWMAHFAVTDAQGGVHLTAERFGRGALGLAGAQAAPFAVHLGDWSVTGPEKGIFPWRLRASKNDAELDFDVYVRPRKPLVLQGEDGFSAKSTEPGNASYYHSFTRLDASGSIRRGDKTFTLRGEAWMDHEWSTSALGRDLVGWDWFALQLEDDRELMIYLMRQRDGGYGVASSGSLVAADGSKRTLGLDDFQLEATGRWTSPETKISYPSGWRLRVPSANLDLRLEPVIADQEMRLAVVYYEGALRVRGKGLKGRGFVELVGYGDE